MTLGFDESLDRPLAANPAFGGTVDQNYLDVKHEYFSPPNDEGHRLRTRDVWYATRPSVPEFDVVDNEDKVVPVIDATVSTAWTLNKAGLSQIIICDRDDINGLRALLDRLEQDFDRRDMEELAAEFHQDAEEEDVD